MGLVPLVFVGGAFVVRRGVVLVSALLGRVVVVWGFSRRGFFRRGFFRRVLFARAGTLIVRASFPFSASAVGFSGR